MQSNHFIFQKLILFRFIMALIMEYLYWMFSDDFLLPEGMSSKNFKDTETSYYVKPSHLIHLPLYAAGILCIRWVYETYIATSIASSVGIIDKRKKPVPNIRLEAVYRRSKYPKEKEISSLSQEMNTSERSLMDWFRRRRNMDHPSKVTKFVETNWRLFFYTAVFIYAISFLVKTPWFWNQYECWVNYPMQPIWPSVYYYYMLEGGFYISLLVSLVRDNKRKDFIEQVVHHLATIFLIVFSYVSNFTRIGTLVMAIHDISDIFLEAAKCFHYAGYIQTSEVSFAVFAVVFIVTRIIMFPFVILHTTWVKSMDFADPYPGYYFFNAMLFVLQLLHIFWASTIVKMAVKLCRGEMNKDERSDVDESSEDDDDKTK